MQLKLVILEKRNSITISKSSICSSNGHVREDVEKIIQEIHEKRSPPKEDLFSLGEGSGKAAFETTNDQS
jgi:hypothetical protein